MSMLVMFDVEKLISLSQRFSMISISDDDDSKTGLDLKSFVKSDSVIASTQTLSSLSFLINYLLASIYPLNFVIFLNFNFSVYSSQSII